MNDGFAAGFVVTIAGYVATAATLTSCVHNLETTAEPNSEFLHSSLLL